MNRSSVVGLITPFLMEFVIGRNGYVYEERGYCCQGDDARSLNVVSPVSFECHVILGETFRRYIQFNCSCKCWIWYNDNQKCINWNFLNNKSSSLLLHSSVDSILYNTLFTTYSSCCGSSSSPSSFYEKTHLELDFECIGIRKTLNSSDCDIDWDDNERCCFVLCEDHRGCSYLQLYPLFNDTRSSLSENNVYTKLLKSHAKEDKSISKTRTKRNSDFLPRIEVLGIVREVAVLQPFQISARVVDKGNVPTGNEETLVELDVIDDRRRKPRDILEGALSANSINGHVNFSNVTFLQVGSSYQLSISSTGSPYVQPWVSDSIRVTERPLTLRPSGRTLPISPRENDTLSPAAGVIIYDELDDAPATRGYLSQYTWEASVALLYESIYPGEVLGSTFQLVEDGSNEILFPDVIISDWGYSYILEIKLRARETEYWNLTCLIGPFDVDMLDTSELPLIESEEFRTVQIVFDGDYQRILEDRKKFEIFFLNYFGRGYPKVRWKNVTLSEGSVVVDAVITGLTEDLDKTSGALAEDIGSGKADIQYENERIWRANRVSVPSRKLLEESGTSESQTAEEGGGGLSVAWIVAIVINVIIIVAFISAIVYCWFRRKKQDKSRTGSAVKHFDGNPEGAMFANKAEIKKKSMEQKAALIDAGQLHQRGIFTIEDERRQLEHQNHRPDERCTCYSPTCYCSIGDGRKTNSRLGRMTEENEDDPQGYPTPSPPPKFPSPEPSPEPEEYWRPDSFQQEEEEEEEDEEMFLPGTVTEPEPERPREDRFYVYHVTDIDGSRELFGQLYLQVDSFLNDVRREIDRDRDLSDAIRKNEYRFLDENLDNILTYQESSLDLERVFPSQEINIQFLQPRKEQNKEPQVAKMPKIPAYVGPLGICSASDCTRAAKIKCLDCRNTAYCSKRCMREDIREHRRACYKPAWRL